MNEITLILIYIAIAVAAITVELTDFKKVAITLLIYGILTSILSTLEGEIIGGVVNFIVVGIGIPLLIMKTTKEIDIQEKEKYSSVATLIISLALSISIVTILLFGIQMNWELSVAVSLIAVGTYALIIKGNFVKMAVGYTIYDSALHLFLSLYAVLYELPINLVIAASLVIDGVLFGIVASILYLAIQTYQKTGTISSWSLRRLRW